MSQPENEAPGPHTERNPGTAPPGAKDSPAAESGARRTSSQPPGSTLGLRPQTSDTLLSLPAPATREELVDERLNALEGRLTELARRMDAVERRSLHFGENPERPRWIWLVFLGLLALGWQIMAFFR